MAYIIPILFLIMTQVFASSPVTSQGNPIAGYYTPQTLFDQTGLESNPSFTAELMRRGYSSTEFDPSPIHCYDIETGAWGHEKSLEDLCESHFLKNRRWMYTRAMMQEGVNLGSIAALMIPVFIVGFYSQNPQIATFSGLVMSTAFLYLVYNSSIFRGIMAAWLFPGNDAYLPFEKEYARRKPELLFLDRNDLKNRQRLGAPSRIEQEFWTARQGMLNPRASMLFLETLVNVPTQSQSVFFNERTLDQRLELYDPTDAQKISRICHLHARGYRDQLGTNAVSPQFMTLIGSPGVGKSSLVDQIGSSLNLPVSRLDLTAATPHTLMGTKDDPGLLLTALCHLKVRNGILFIDEFCHIAKNEDLLATLLTILDPSRKTFYSPYLELTIDISHLFIIIAGNEELTQQALLDRFTIHKTVRLSIHNQDLYTQIIARQSGSQLRERLKGQSFRDDLARLEMEQL